MKSFILLFALVTSLHSSSLFAKAFHLLIMGDTQDPKISVSVYKSIQNIEESFSYLASASNIPLYTKKLTMHDGTLTRRNIAKWIHKESVAHDDVIILYYHGHGARLTTSPTIWPFGCMRFDEKDKYNENVEFSLLVEKLFSKKAALCLVILDCCNTFFSYAFPKDLTSINRTAFDLQTYKNQNIATGCQELFSKSYGLIIASAASPGEAGWCNVDTNAPKEVGGVFTNIFLNNFFQTLQSARPHWQDIFMQTRIGCKEETKKEKYRIEQGPNLPQTPQYKIFLYKHRRSPRVYKKHLFKGCEMQHLKELDPSVFSIASVDEVESNIKTTSSPEVPVLDSEEITEEDLVAIE